MDLPACGAAGVEAAMSVGEVVVRVPAEGCNIRRY